VNNYKETLNQHNIVTILISSNPYKYLLATSDLNKSSEEYKTIKEALELFNYQRDYFSGHRDLMPFILQWKELFIKKEDALIMEKLKSTQIYQKSPVSEGEISRLIRLVTYLISNFDRRRYFSKKDSSHLIAINCFQEILKIRIKHLTETNYEKLFLYLSDYKTESFFEHCL